MSASHRNNDEFQLFMSQLLETHFQLGDYTDFEKCYTHISRIAVKLNALNYLVGKEDLTKAVYDLWAENPRTFTVLDVLIAIRSKDKKKILTPQGKLRLIEDFFNSAEGVIEYIEATGLADIFRNKQISNLVDYVFGIEVGLDTNARKNRGGQLMEALVAERLRAAGISFRSEIYSREFPEVSQALGVDSKRFDFVIASSDKTYLIEVNFYSSGGSKLNEVARAYSELAPKINACKGYEFIWVTDGAGWHSAKGKLEEAFYTIPSIYNLTTLENFLEKIQQ